MNRDRFLQWDHWWQLFIRKDHEAQAVELFLSLHESAQAELLGWLAGRSRRTREKIKAWRVRHKMQQEIIADLRREMEGMKKWMQEEQTVWMRGHDDLTRQIRELKGLPPLDRAAG